MSESLVIRLGSHHQQPIPWLVWSAQEQEIIASGELANASALAELTERAGGRPLIALVPASDMIFRQLTLPSRYNRQSAAALPYLLEEQIASDVDDLHVVVIQHQGTIVDVMACDNANMQTWLAWLQQAGLTAQQLLPDVLALPHLDGSWHALQLADEWLFRQGPAHGIATDSNLLPLILASQTEPISVLSPTPIPALALPELIQWQQGVLELPMQVLAKGAQTSHANLLTGPYRPQTEYARYWRQWRKLIITAALLLLVALAQRFVSLYQLGAQEQAVKAETQQVFKRIFPSQTRIVNVRSQMTQYLNQMGQSSQGGLLQMLTELAPAFAAQPSLKPEVIRFDASRQELRLQLNAPSFSEIEKWRELAGKQFSVQQGEMRSSGGRVQGTLVIKGKSS